MTAPRDGAAGPPPHQAATRPGRLDLPGLDGTRWTVRAPRDIADRLIVSMAGLDREELHVALLNTKNVVLGIERVYQGNVSASLVWVGELFREAVHRHAAGVILVHNHPSGDPTARK